MSSETDFLRKALQRESPEKDLLEVLGGPEDGRVFFLEGRSMKVGRLHENDLVLELDGLVSRSHAAISHQDGQYSIEDLGSTHGTRVNGEKVKEKTKVRDGDDLLVGATMLRVRLRRS